MDGPRLLLRKFVGLVLLSLSVTSLPRVVNACPFCTAQGNTILQEIEASSRACIVRATKTNTMHQSFTEGDVPSLPFVKVQDLLGRSSTETTLSLPALESWKVDDQALVLGFTEGDSIEWTAPTKLSPPAICYLEGVLLHRQSELERLRYVAKWLDEVDGWVMDDVYREFAQASYAVLSELKSDLDANWLKSQITQSATSPERRRLYWTLLSVCGEASDALWIEQVLEQHDRQRDGDLGLEAAAACYLCLAKADGLDYLKSRYLHPQEVSYVHVNAIVQAIRFHLTEVDYLERPLLVQCLREILKFPDLADLVIPDLARFEDWGAIDPLMTLYQTPQCSVNVRVQTIRYLQICPSASAKEALETCRALDPVAYRRAQILAIVPQPPKQ